MATATEDKKHLSSVADEDADEATIQAANALPDKDKGGDDSKSIEDLAEEDTPTPPMQIAIPGTRETIPGRMGGNRPTSSEIRLMGGRLPVEGIFEKGEVVEFIVKAKIGEAGEVDSHDAWGNVQKTVRVHKARMIEVTRHDAP